MQRIKRVGGRWVVLGVLPMLAGCALIPLGMAGMGAASGIGAYWSYQKGEEARDQDERETHEAILRGHGAETTKQ